MIQILLFQQLREAWLHSGYVKMVCNCSFMTLNRHTVDMSHWSDSNLLVNSSPSQSSASTSKWPCALKISRSVSSFDECCGLTLSISIAEGLKICHVFVMTGAALNIRWLDGCVALDPKGFIKTGPDLSPEDLSAARWPLVRVPYLLETSLLRVFATGEMCVAAASNVSRPRLAKDRLQLHLFIRYSRNRGSNAISELCRNNEASFSCLFSFTLPRAFDLN